LLSQGIGDTLRVSLAADPVEEVKVGFEILKSLELRHRGVNVIACPTCGRVEIDVVKMANELEHRLGHIKNPITVSVLGCVVNGIGEGKEADIGIAGGQGVGIVFKKGKPYKRVPSEELMDILIEEVEAMAKEQDAESSGSSVSPSSPSTPPLEELLLASVRPSSREIPMLPLK
jgi:(E)-4-hydroxy-3-methylbut-2-enyl-diphosphate synthase